MHRTKAHDVMADARYACEQHRGSVLFIFCFAAFFVLSIA
jgi:hypothetical protein